MATSFDPAATPKPVETGILEQVDLIACALTEKVRRRQVRDNIGVGAWAVVTDPKLVEQLGEEIVRVTEVRGSSRVVQAMFNCATAVAAEGQIKPCLMAGDVVMSSGGPVVVLNPRTPEPGTPPTAWGVSPRWGVDGAALDEPSTIKVAVRDQLQQEGRVEVALTADTIQPRVFTHCERGMAVRGVLSRGIGPDLEWNDFLKVAQFAEPCAPRPDTTGGIITDVVDGKKAVLCDFIGGATLWIWAEVLVEFPLVLQWADSPSHGRHPETKKIRRPSASRGGISPTTAVGAAIDAHHPAALPEASHLEPLALSITTSMKEIMSNTNEQIIASLCAAGKLARGTVIIVDDTYRPRMEAATAAIQGQWSGQQLDDSDTLDDLSDIFNEQIESGAYEVRKPYEIDLPDGRTIAAVVCTVAGQAGGDRFNFFVALTRVAGGQVALPDRTGDGVVARAVKGAGSKALDVAKDAFIGAKDMVIDEGKRKALALAQVASQDTLVTVHETVRRTMLAGGAAFMGADSPESAAASKALVQGFDMATIAGGKFVARLLAKHAPGTSKMIDAATDTLQQGIDQKQAKSVLDQAMPLIGGGLKALGQAAAQRFLPALAAPAPAAALPSPATTPTPPVPDSAPAPTPAPAKPKRSRPSRAKSQNGGAQ